MAKGWYRRFMSNTKLDDKIVDTPYGRMPLKDFWKIHAYEKTTAANAEEFIDKDTTKSNGCT